MSEGLGPSVLLGFRHLKFSYGKVSRAIFILLLVAEIKSAQPDPLTRTK
jgi:hypothetical protein